MKVVYDISALGYGYYRPPAKAGIFRVIENLARGLHRSEDCDLIFCASESFMHLNESLDYVASDSEFKDVPFPYPKIERDVYRQINALKAKINKTPSESQKFLLKVIKKLLTYESRLLQKTLERIDPTALNNSDIFHSCIYPLPKQTKKIKSIKNFLTIHDLIPVLFPSFCDKDVDKFFMKILESIDPSTWVTCVSKSTKNDLCNQIKIDPNRVFVTYLAASPELFYPCSNLDAIAQARQKYNIPNAPYILSLSTLEPRKNLDHLIKCFSQLIQQEKISDLYLVLVGTKGWKYEKIFETAANFNVASDRIIFTGSVADEDLAAVYSGALAFVYPTFYEGFGLPPLEAMQCGIPVITSNTSSLPEVVGDAGILLSPTDADGLCHNLLSIYNSPALRSEMSARSLQQASKFSWDQCVQETIAAYKVALQH